MSAVPAQQPLFTFSKEINMLSPVKIWRNQLKIRNLLGRQGKIITFTQIFVPPAGFEGQAPYVVAIAQLDKKKKVIAQLVDWQAGNLKIGQKIITVLRRTRDPGSEGIIPYGIKLKPLS